MARKTQQTGRATPNKPLRQRDLSPRTHRASGTTTRASLASGKRRARPDMARTAGRKSQRNAQPTAPRGATRGRSGSVNKSAFVRSLPSSLSAAEVIQKGKAKGIKLSAAQVYTIRANARRKAPETDGARGLRSAGRDGAKGRGRADNREAEFVAAALDLGLARAEMLIRALRAKASSGWS